MHCGLKFHYSLTVHIPFIFVWSFFSTTLYSLASYLVYIGFKILTFYLLWNDKLCCHKLIWCVEWSPGPKCGVITKTQRASCLWIMHPAVRVQGCQPAVTESRFIRHSLSEQSCRHRQTGKECRPLLFTTRNTDRMCSKSHPHTCVHCTA